MNDVGLSSGVLAGGRMGRGVINCPLS